MIRTTPHALFFSLLAFVIASSGLLAQDDVPAPKALPVNGSDEKAPKALPVIPEVVAEEEDGAAMDEAGELPVEEEGPIEDDSVVPRATLVLPGEEEEMPAPRALPVGAVEKVDAPASRLEDWNGGKLQPEKEEMPEEKPEVEEPPKPEFKPPPLREVKTADGGEEKPSGAPIGAAWETRTEARTLTLQVPAPRGQITDRYGAPLAQNKIGNFMALKMPFIENATDRKILAYANERIDSAARYLGKEWSLSDEAILKHYKNRRWLPLPFSPMLSTHQQEVMEKRLGSGVELFPTYQRYYPERSTACHIIGYVGKKTRQETGPVVSGQPLWPISEGREGLEVTFDEYLDGKPGSVNYLFDTDGKKLAEEMVEKPVPGHNVVTSIDLEMQYLAEKTLRKYTRKGALVVMDVQTGDVYAMASAPTYDINAWVPGISPEKFKALQADPSLPMVPRAFRGQYPPASTFKMSVALAALESGVIDGSTLIDCPNALRIGNETFRNWNKKGEGRMNVVGAIKRSCNTFFYDVGRRTGAENVSSMAHRLGFGTQTGIPLNAEEDGFMPTEANIQKRYGHSFSHGYLAQASIGQWTVTATPLQVAQMMAGIANGYVVPKPRLVLQVQDLNNNVLERFDPEERNALNLTPKNLGYVRQGMIDVVNASSGTGKAASNYYVTMAGKTGTGQWIQNGEKLYLSWFSGYLPAENPKYAFAAVCEGRPGEYISGGKKAAPLVGEFFNTVYKRKKARGELGGYARTSKATGGSTASVSRPAPTAAEAPEATSSEEGTPVTAEPRRRGIFGFGRRKR